jgi:hypothetical protein
MPEIPGMSLYCAVERLAGAQLWREVHADGLVGIFHKQEIKE